MKIESLQVSVETLPLIKPFKTALRTAMEIENIMISVKLEDGTEGLGLQPLRLPSQVILQKES